MPDPKTTPGWYLAGCFLCVFNLGFAAGATVLRWHLGAW